MRHFDDRIVYSKDDTLQRSFQLWQQYIYHFDNFPNPTNIDNTYLPFKPGTVFTYSVPGGTDTVEVTDRPVEVSPQFIELPLHAGEHCLSRCDGLRQRGAGK